MTWNSTAEFLAMGGYGGYVWGSFGVVAVLLGIESVLVARRRTAALRSLRQQALAERLEKEAV
jgi:heme exporter protein D